MNLKEGGSVNERIKKLRRALELTQQGFSDRIGIKRNTLANYEIGRNEPIDAVITLICRTFNVNETWLRTGEGEMFNNEPADVLDALVEKYGLSHDARVLVEEFVNLKPDIQQTFIDYARKVVAAFRSVDEISPEPPVPNTKPDDEDAALKAAARKQAEAYYEQLLLEASTRTSGASTPAKAG